MRYISNSELETWRECPRKWWLEYVRCLRRTDPAFGTAYVGTVVHEALDTYYSSSDREEAEARVLADLDTRHDEATYNDSDPREAGALDHARVMLAGYFDWLAEEGVDADWDISGSEETLVMPLSGGVSLVGKLDLRVTSRETGFRGAVDHKTTGNLDELERWAPRRNQFKHYLLLANHQFPGEFDGLAVNGIKRSKRTARASGPFFSRFTVRFNPQALVTYEKQVRAEVDRLSHTEQMLSLGADHQEVCTPRANSMCHKTCTFSGVCPMFDDGSDPESVLSFEFTQVDPLERYGNTLP